MGQSALVLILILGIAAPSGAASHRPWFQSVPKPAAGPTARSIEPDIPLPPIPLPPKQYSQKKASIATATKSKPLRTVSRQPWGRNSKRAVIAKRRAGKNPPAASPRAEQKVVREAMQYKGVRYKFGGTTRKGMDCSAFVKNVYEKIHSYELPRTAAELYRRGEPVKKRNLRVGDVIFFKNTYKRGISHVGIYLGNGRFIHASSHVRRVTVSRLQNNRYYQSHYAGARRFLGV